MNAAGSEAAAYALLATALALLATQRLRADAVALLALGLGVATGLVPVAQAFAGFGDPAVASLALIGVCGIAVARSGLVERALRRVFPILAGHASQAALAGGAAALLAAAVGGRASLLACEPLTGTIARRHDRHGATLRRVLGVAATLGALATAVGTPAALIAFTVTRGLPGGADLLAPLPIGLPLAALGIGALVLLRGRGQRGAVALPVGEAPAETFVAEVPLAPGSPAIGLTVAALEAGQGAEARVVGVIREDYRRLRPRPDWTIEPADLLVIEARPDTLLRLIEQHGAEAADIGGRAAIAEAVITPTSELVGRSVDEAGLRARLGLSVLAIGRAGGEIAIRLRRVKLRAGDVLLVRGDARALPAALTALGCLLLAERRLRQGRGRQVWAPLCLTLVALALALLGWLPLPLALAGAVAGMLVAGALVLDDVYHTIPWPTVALAAALLPLIEAGRSGGVFVTLARWGAEALAGMPALVAVALVGAVGLALAAVSDALVVAALLAPVAAGMEAALPVPPLSLVLAVAVACGSQSRAPWHEPNGRGWSALRLGLLALVLVAPPVLILAARGWP